jgi:hypothetical protein
MKRCLSIVIVLVVVTPSLVFASWWNPFSKKDVKKVNIESKSVTNQNKQKSSQCNPNYSGCLKSGAGDYDCANGSGNGPNYTGKVKVLGNDEFDLDRDNDGWGCESR